MIDTYLILAIMGLLFMVVILQLKSIKNELSYITEKAIESVLANRSVIHKFDYMNKQLSNIEAVTKDIQVPKGDSINYKDNKVDQEVSVDQGLPKYVKTYHVELDISSKKISKTKFKIQPTKELDGFMYPCEVKFNYELKLFDNKHEIVVINTSTNPVKFHNKKELLPVVSNIHKDMLNSIAMKIQDTYGEDKYSYLRNGETGRQVSAFDTVEFLDKTIHQI